MRESRRLSRAGSETPFQVVMQHVTEHGEPSKGSLQTKHTARQAYSIKFLAALNGWNLLIPWESSRLNRIGEMVCANKANLET